MAKKRGTSFRFLKFLIVALLLFSSASGAYAFPLMLRPGAPVSLPDFFLFRHKHRGIPQVSPKAESRSAQQVQDTLALKVAAFRAFSRSA